MNPFLQYETDRTRSDFDIGSGRFYARYSQSEEGVKGQRPGSPASAWFFEAFDAQWFDANTLPESINAEGLAEYYQRAGVYVLELLYQPEILPLIGALAPLQSISENDDEPATWFSIQVNPPSTASSPNEGLALTVYNNLFGPGVSVSLREVSEVSPETQGRLNRAISTDIFPSATVGQIDAVLSLPGNIPLDWAVVYDVGQGGSNGLCETPGFVRTYLDFGGGVMQNAFTFPAALQNSAFPQILRSSSPIGTGITGLRPAGFLGLVQQHGLPPGRLLVPFISH